MVDDDFCNDAEEWKQIADSYAYELEDCDARIDDLQARIEQLEALLREIVDPLVTAFPSIKEFPSIKNARAALEGKKDD